MRPASFSAESSLRATERAASAQGTRSLFDVRASLLNVAAALIVLIIVAVILKELRVVLQPLFIAVFLFFIADPAVAFLERRRWPSALAHLTVMGGSFVLLLLFAGLMIERVDDLARQLPKFQDRLQEVATATAGEVPTDLPFFRRHARSVVSSFDIMGPVGSAVKGFMAGMVGFGAGVILAAIYLVFLIHEQKALPPRLVAIYGEEKAQKIALIGARIKQSIARYIYIKMLASLISAGIALAAMLAFGLDLAVLWAAILFLLNFIPYVGSIVGFAFPLGVAILQFDSVWPILGLAIIFTAIDILVGNYWEPKVAGQRLNVSPVVVIFALAFWGWLWGTVGMILAVPITVSLRFVLENIPYTQPLAVLMSNRPPRRREAV